MRANFELVLEGVFSKWNRDQHLMVFIRVARRNKGYGGGEIPALSFWGMGGDQYSFED